MTPQLRIVIDNERNLRGLALERYQSGLRRGEILQALGVVFGLAIGLFIFVLLVLP